MQGNKKKNTIKNKKKKVQKEVVESDGSQEWQEQKQQKPKQEKYVLYKLLNIERTATLAEIKSSYKQLALKLHPDKNKEDPEAADKFNKITEAYKLLTNQEKRKEYDETGYIGEQFNQQAFQSAYQYFRQIYKKIEKEDIEDFSKRYRHGQMEKEDLIDYYNSRGGDMKELLECIPLSVDEDIPRFISFFEKNIKQKKLEQTKKFLSTKNKVRKIKRQDKQVEEELERRKKETQKDMSSLIMAIQGKKSNFLDMMEKKYGNEEVKQKKKQKT